MKNVISLLTLCLSASLSAQTITNYNTNTGLPSNDLRDVAIDGSGNVWLASQAGVIKFDGVNAENHTPITHPGLVSSNVMAIAVMDNGDIWAGTDNGVSVFDGTDYVTYSTADGLSNNQVNNIKQAPNGDIWLATINGATVYSNGVFTAFGSPDIPFGGTTYIAFADDGDVWLGTGLAGIKVYDGSSFTSIVEADGLINNKIRSIAIDGAQNKWVATAKGISTFDANDQFTGNQTRPFILPAPDTLNPVTDVVLDSQGLVWAGVYVDYLVTEGGVSMYDGNDWAQYELSNGLAGPNVRRLAVDADDAVWVTTSSGLSKISGVRIGIEEEHSSVEFSLYPNPANTELNVVMTSPILDRTQVQLFDAQLRLVGTAAVRNGTVLIDISGFDPGMYVARVGSAIRKFVVK
ncbi:MAG: two-component regulator propeller domain-containing protein [Flavobacteriales bacterium]